jgi:hypothetical protein
LQRVRVSFGGEKDVEKITLVRIEADFVTESIREPVSFPIVIQRLSGKVDVYVG